jgi:hypothetical protein
MLCDHYVYQSRPSYTVDVVSHHPKYKNITLKKYGIEGVDTVGAWGDEPFEIRFKNNTNKKVQVKLSVDGTDILTGAPASTDASGQMWQVNAYGTLSIKAWPESQNGGAALVFTSANNSVALNTHGDMSCRGIIAAAVFEETYVEPVRVNTYFSTDCSYDTKSCRRSSSSSRGPSLSKGLSFNDMSRDCDDSLGEIQAESNDNVEYERGGLKSLASVGAGNFVNQHISYTKGFVKPMFTETIRVKYVWWDDLKAKLDSIGYVNSEQPTGFPADKPNKMIDLKNTPRIDTPQELTYKKSSFRRAEQEQTWSRF